MQVITASFRLRVHVALLKPRGIENTEASAFKDIFFRKTRKSHLCYRQQHWEKHCCYSWEESARRAAIRQRGKKKKRQIDIFVFQHF